MTDDYATRLYQTLFIPMTQNNLKDNNN